MKAKWEIKEIEHVYFMRKMQDGVAFFVNGANYDDANSRAEAISAQILAIA